MAGAFVGAIDARPARQRFVEHHNVLSLVLVTEPPLQILAGILVHRSNLLITRVKITTYNPHESAPFLRALVVKRYRVYSLAGSRSLHGITEAKDVSTPLGNLTESLVGFPWDIRNLESSAGVILIGISKHNCATQ